jgi:L-phenylalanine/L-methionine N-acetyltransferase
MSLTIRHAVPDDYLAVTLLFDGPKAVWGTIQVPFPSPEVWRKRLSDPEPGLITLVACSGSDLVGIVGLHSHLQQPRRRHAIRLGMTVRDDFQGRGVGTALLTAALELADGWLNVTRVELDVWTDNEPALRLYRKHGFEVEGTLRQFAFREGRLVDAYVMGRLLTPPAPSSTSS